MPQSSKQLSLLLWKNWLIQKKRIALTIFEIGLPAFFTLILLLVRTKVDAQFIGNFTTWSDFRIGNTFPDNLEPQSYYCNVTYPLPRQFWLANVPDNAVVRRVTASVASRLNMHPSGLGFDTEEQLEKHMQEGDSCWKLDVLAGLVFTSEFPDENTLPQTISYKLRPPAEQKFGRTGVIRFFSASEWFTSFTFPNSKDIGPREDDWHGGRPGYYREGFLALQRAVDLAIIQELNASADVDRIETRLKRHPYPPYREDSFVNVLQLHFPFILMLSFIVVTPNICKDICLEKEKKLKETMKLMGLHNWLHWSAWFIKFAIFMIISVAFMTLFLHLPTRYGAIINYTHPTVTFVFLLLYGLATVFFCFAVSAFFTSANGGAAAGGILFLITFVPFFFLQVRMDTLTAGQKAGASVLHNLAMSFGCHILGQFEGRGVGIQWSTLNTRYSPEHNFTMMHVFLLLLLDWLIYGLITWYMDAVLPGKYGVPKPVYFPCTSRYWCGPSEDRLNPDDLEQTGHGEREPYFEPCDKTMKAGIRIRNLSKKFKKSGKTIKAVSDLSLDMIEGQVTALLGHNGAGKTTTMSMLTGFIPPSKGTAYINGYSIVSDIDSVRQNLGLCPQHDVLFDTMTVKEHLTFYAKLKGVHRKGVAEKVINMIELLKLELKTNVEARKLSGGQKRKLSVGIALIGDSKFVILDEPTSGMDPEARRQMWEILKTARIGRTMILSTHYMEEADFLGDRIAIMANGIIQCCGSPLFLKSKYGKGYHMVLVKDSHYDNQIILDIVKSHVPKAQLDSNLSAEMSFVLPSDSSDKFEKLFDYLENNRHELGISSYGASATTMEEVFLKVGEAADENSESTKQSLSSLQNHNTHTDTKFPSSQDVNDTSVLTQGVAVANGTVKHDIMRNGVCKVTQVDDEPSTETPQNGFINHAFQMEDGVSKVYRSADYFQNSENRYVKDLDGKSLTLHQNEAKEKHQKQMIETVFGGHFERNTGRKLQMEQFKAMLLKRIIHSGRNKVVTITQIIIPLVFTIAACAVMVTLPGPREPPSYNLTINNFDQPIVPYLIRANNETGEATVLSEAYLDVLAGTQVLDTPPVQDEPWFSDNTTMDNYLSRAAEENQDIYTREHMTAASFFDNTWDNFSRTTVLGHFNNEAWHTPAITLSLIGKTLLRHFVGDGYNIHASNHPLPREASSRVNEELNTTFATAFIIAYCTSFGMAFLTATFVVFLIRERNTKAKHIQFVSGVHQVNYWFSTFVWDYVNFLIPSLLLVVVYVAFQIEAYSSGESIGVILCTFFLFGWAILPLVYLFSFVFDVPASGYRWLTILSIITGTAAIIAVVILKSPELNTKLIGQILEWVFYVALPNYCFGNILGDVFINYNSKKICLGMEADLNITNSEFCFMSSLVNITNPCCFDSCGGYCAFYTDSLFDFKYPGAGRGLTFMSIQGAVFLAILFLIESNWAHSTKQKAAIGAAKSDHYIDDIINMEEMEQEDSDVTAERHKVLSLIKDNLLMRNSSYWDENRLVLGELKKYYGSFLAVDSLCVGVAKGECFGLLGVNGAGKTSTFKMLTGDETVSAGDAYLCGYGVTEDLNEVQQRLGYCPQFDALINQMTVRETLNMYARLRGVHEKYIDQVVSDLIQSLYLSDNVNKQAGDLSGGNKRKLSTAIALVGEPPVIFLDEPTTGMDPVARRMLWQTLTRARDRGKTIILTSHSMEECEALCTRLAIMVNGKFRCLGSPQHLKAKYSDGYTLIAKLNQSESLEGTISSTQRLKSFIEVSFPLSVLKDEHAGLVQYQVSNKDVTWAAVFAKMEQAKVEYDLEDYSVSQTTLEQVFLNFARSQVAPREEGELTCKVKCGNCCKYFCCSCCHK